MRSIKVTRTDLGGIRLNFQVEGKRYSLHPIRKGRFDNPLHYGQAYAMAQLISTDIEAGLFDATLEKYKPASQKKLKEIETKLETDLLDLWLEYTDSRKGHIAQSTLDIGYKRIERLLDEIPYKKVNQAKDIKLWIVSNKSPISAKKILTQLNACAKWALDLEKIDINPFADFAKMLNKKTTVSEDDINPFDEHEKTQILNVFRDHPRHNHYYGLIHFLFACGCRPSEAIALTWKDVKNNKIIFNKTYVNGKLSKRLKTQGQRIISQNQTIKNILEKQKEYLTEKKFNTDLVFPGMHGKAYIDWSNFTFKVWQPLINSIENFDYRPPYQIRHTFITNALTKVSVQDVAKHCGNSPQVIFQHYAGITKGFVMPEI